VQLGLIKVWDEFGLGGYESEKFGKYTTFKKEE